MKSPDRNILILYGSETGNAQDYAEELGRICQRLYFKSHVEELNAIELSALLQHELVVFVISTTGQGDMPHNSLLFWKKLLRKKLPLGCLNQLKYTCFGLGDSTYIKFNWAARKLVRRLDQLGATTFHPVYEADEQFPDGIDGSFVRWADDLRKQLLENYPPPLGLEPIPDDTILPPRWSLEPALRRLDVGHADGIGFSKLSLQENNDTSTQSQQPNLPPTELVPVPNGWTATLVENQRLTPPSHWQDVRLVSFDIDSRGEESRERLQCAPGDCLTLYPKNFPADAQKLITLMGWEAIADQHLDLSACEESLPRNFLVPHPCTLRNLLLHNIDITAIPRRSFLKSMSYFSTDEYHRQRLLEFTMPEYLDEYFDYATRSRRSIIEVLEEFTSVRIPAERLLDVFPLIRGRDFSIANGGASLTLSNNNNNNNNTAQAHRPHATRVQLLIALVKYRTILRKPREGLCSRYIADLPVGSTIAVSHKSVLSPIHGAANAQRPLIAMATGTGIAPVRNLIHERLTHPSPGPTLIFFGNRNRNADFFFQEEWHSISQQASASITTTAAAAAAAVEEGGGGGEEKDEKDENFHIFPAFSRDQQQKIYVQDIIRQEAPKIARVMHNNPIFVVCGGSSKMADACKRAIFDPLISKNGGGDGQGGGKEKKGKEENEVNGGERGEEEEVEERRKKLIASVTWWQEIW